MPFVVLTARYRDAARTSAASVRFRGNSVAVGYSVGCRGIKVGLGLGGESSWRSVKCNAAEHRSVAINKPKRGVRVSSAFFQYVSPRSGRHMRVPCGSCYRVVMASMQTEDRLSPCSA